MTLAEYLIDKAALSRSSRVVAISSLAAAIPFLDWSSIPLARRPSKAGAGVLATGAGLDSPSYVRNCSGASS
jgi:hypothetical protein